MPLATFTHGPSAVTNQRLRKIPAPLHRLVNASACFTFSSTPNLQIGITGDAAGDIRPRSKCGHQPATKENTRPTPSFSQRLSLFYFFFDAEFTDRDNRRCRWRHSPTVKVRSPTSD